MAESKVEEIPDRIVETFRNQNILITGGTGFLGKVVIEKFLRCVPSTEQIYLLVRSKKGKDPKHRIEEIFNSPVSGWLFSFIKHSVSYCNTLKAVVTYFTFYTQTKFINLFNQKV